MSVDLSQFIPTFLEESFEGLEVMESGLLNFQAGDNETINAIFRAAHSIKGGSGTFGFKQITEFTHVVETLLDEIRSEKRAFSEPLRSILLEAGDCIRLLLEAARDGQDCEAPEVDKVYQQLKAILSGEPAAPTVAESPETVDEPSAIGAAGAVSAGWLIRFVPHPHLLCTGNEPGFMLAALADLGETDVTLDLANLPSLETLAPESIFLSWTIRLHSSCAEAEVREIFEWVEDDCDLVVEPLPIMDVAAPIVAGVADQRVAEEPSAAADAASEPPEAAKADVPSPVTSKRAEESEKAPKKNNTETTSIRVGIDKVDGLINRVGELVITQSMLGQIGSELSHLEEKSVQRLHEGLAQLERNTRDLQEEVMRIRMLPISFVFNRFPRMVHDVSSKLGKQVELKLSGEQTELDKTVMEKIGDPLVHLVRNSLDHGLENPAERVAAGKPETGTVHLNAFHQGGFIIIEITDDGRGLNTQRIREKALEKGLISADQVLTETDIHELVFRPGFSTATEVSDLSGRGVGMDVVRRNIESLGGHVGVRSQAGVGSTFTVSLPLTLAILDGQLVSVAEDTYIVPLVSVIESIQINPSALKSIAGAGRLYRFRDEYIPVMQLRRVFHLPVNTRALDNRLMVVVEGGGFRAGLVVDDLLGQQQVVIKSLETNYRRVEGLSGATILGNGDVALILDVAGLIKIGLEPATLRAAQHKNQQLAEQRQQAEESV